MPLAGVCLGRTVTVEHVRALVLAGQLPAPVPRDLVPRDYLAEIDPDPAPALESEEWQGISRARSGATATDGRDCSTLQAPSTAAGEISS